jgi:hypothetical protein
LLLKAATVLMMQYAAAGNTHRRWYGNAML